MHTSIERMIVIIFSLVLTISLALPLYTTTNTLIEEVKKEEYLRDITAIINFTIYTAYYNEAIVLSIIEGVSGLVIEQKNTTSLSLKITYNDTILEYADLVFDFMIVFSNNSYRVNINKHLMCVAKYIDEGRYVRFFLREIK
ncbi:MAG: hypothetical protein ACTSSP_11985 [Candidatus Asgardarchaeia archaeon]